MLKIIRSAAELDFRQLMHVCGQSIRKNGMRDHPYASMNMQTILAEQDFYAYLQMFFKDPDALCAVWEVEDAYKTVLRLERYGAGYIIAGLETAPEERRKGYAKKLIEAVQAYLKGQGETELYSHIDKKNLTSIGVHAACGFRRSSEHAVFLDGSVSHSSYTFTYICE